MALPLVFSSLIVTRKDNKWQKEKRERSVKKKNGKRNNLEKKTTSNHFSVENPFSLSHNSSHRKHHPVQKNSEVCVMNDVQEHQSQSPLMFAMAFAQKPQVPHMLTPLPSLTLPSTHFLPFTRDCPLVRDAFVHVCSVGTQQLLKMAPSHFHIIQPSTLTVFSSLFQPSLNTPWLETITLLFSPLSLEIVWLARCQSAL